MGNKQSDQFLVSGRVFQDSYYEYSRSLCHPDFEGQFVNISTGCWQILDESFYSFRNKNCMAELSQENHEKRATYKFQTYHEVAQKIAVVANGIASLNTGSEELIGIWSKNCPEWMICCLASWRQGHKVVPFYETLGAEAMLYILEQTRLTVLFTESARVKTIIELIKSNKVQLKLETLVVFDSKNVPNILQDLSLLDLRLIHLAEFQNFPDVSPNPGNSDDIAVIMYTSGSTGQPKGVLLAHSNIASTAYWGEKLLEKFPKVLKKLRYYSYLPLPHILEMAMEITTLCCGGCIYYYSGDVKKVIEELALVRPTLFAGVPRIYQKMYGKIMLQSQSGIKGWMLRKALGPGGKKLTRKIIYNNFLSIVNKKLGLNKCKLLLSGAAPLPIYLHRFMLTLLPKASLLQGYGLTETSACATLMHPDDREGGHVGGPSLVNFIRLRDVPEMSRMHFNTPPDGEILVGGPCTFKGYYKNDAETRKVLFESNRTMWVATGDIGVMRPDGSIKIVDRKKNIFKLSQGEYIAVEKIEMVYQKCLAVNQIWVYGNSFKPCIVAVVNPSLPWVWQQPFFPARVDVNPLNAKEAGPIFAEWIDDEGNRLQVTASITAELAKVEGDLKGFEKVRAVYVEATMSDSGIAFNQENGLLTPSMKLVRLKLKIHYLEQLKNMYAGLGMPSQEGESWI